MKFACFNQWEQLPESVDDLFSEYEKESLFLSRDWFETLSKYSLLEGQTLKLICVFDHEIGLAILPMMKTTQGGLSCLSNQFTTSYSLLINKLYDQQAILNCLAEGLVKMEVTSFHFSPIDKDDQLMIQLCDALKIYDLQCHWYFRFNNWFHTLDGDSYEQYIVKRPSKLINTIKRKKNKLQKKHAYEIRLFTDNKISQALADYNEVYQASWKANELAADFTPNLVKRLALLGWLRLAVLYVNQSPIAAQIWFTVHSKANIYRLVYDERWKQYSPGSILTDYMMEYVINTDKVTEVDFLTGNEKYKQDWMREHRQLHGVRIARNKVGTHKLKKLHKLVKRLFGFINQKDHRIT